MALTDILSKLQSLLPDDSGEAKALLADAKREANTILDDLKSANAESAKRKTEIRELKSELENTADSKELQDKLRAETELRKKLEANLAEIKETENQKVINQWAEKAKLLNVGKEHKLYDKIQDLKSEFHTPAEGETITADQAAANLKAFGLLEKTGLFTVPDTKTPNAQPPNVDRTKDVNPFVGKFK